MRGMSVGGGAGGEAETDDIVSDHTNAAEWNKFHNGSRYTATQEIEELWSFW